MVINKDEVCIFIPTLNEAPTIESLILSFKEMGYGDILVMDGKSTDRTVEIAQAAGAKVKIQTGKGKGQAIIEAIEDIDKPYILMLDGDNSHHIAEAAFKGFGRALSAACAPDERLDGQIPSTKGVL